MRHRLFAATATAVLAVSTVAAPLAGAAVAEPDTSTTQQRDILERIQAVPGVTSVTEKEAPAGYRYFVMTFRQPVDHKHPERGSFDQRITLLHKDTARPMVMYTSGYGVSTNPSRSEPTQIADGNQLSMEYRFFEPSRPKNPDWDKQLTIWQAATDQHRIIEAFSSVYDQRWITTGGSKGGMTATYHRRFYPDDVAGTVPYVAPNDIDDAEDSAYERKLSTVGPAQCRQDIIAVQRRLLGSQRPWFLAKMKEADDREGNTYTIVGDREIAFEASVIDLYFGFYQYHPVSECADVPKADATNEEVLDWVNEIGGLTSAADQGLEAYLPYYYQSAYQMGGPPPYETPIADLLKHPGTNVSSTFVPENLRPRRFDHSAMKDIDRWVQKKSTRMLFINGQNDPWSSEPFSCGDKKADARDCARYTVPGGTHGSQIAQLPDAERARATALVLKFAGLGDADPAAQQIERTGEPTDKGKMDVIRQEEVPLR